MAKVICPYCEVEGEIDNEWLGEEVECPECEEVYIAEAVRKSRHDLVRRAAPKRSKLIPVLGCLGILALVGTGIFVFFYMAYQQDQKLYRHGLIMMKKESFKNDINKQIAVYFVDLFHNRARNTAPGYEKKLWVPEDAYWERLKELAVEEFKFIKANDLGKASTQSINGGWYFQNFKEGYYFYCFIKGDGNYYLLKVEGGSGLDYLTDPIIYNGKWKLKDNSINWGGDNDTKVLFHTPNHLIIHETDGSVTTYKRVNKSDFETFKTLLKSSEIKPLD